MESLYAEMSTLQKRVYVQRFKSMESEIHT